VLLDGACVIHEIDVLAEKEGNIFTIECKFHLNTKTVSNIKIPLYINSRFLDVQKKWNENPHKSTFLKQGWLVTNTRFTKDAINYGKCAGLILLSWNYPIDNGISKTIDQFGLRTLQNLIHKIFCRSDAYDNVKRFIAYRYFTTTPKNITLCLSNEWFGCLEL